MLTIPTTSKDLGNIPYNVPVTITYDVINESDFPVNITNTSAGCGCTMPSISVNPIPPHSTAIFQCIYNAAARGNNKKTANLQEEGQDSVTFYFSANVV